MGLVATLKKLSSDNVRTKPSYHMSDMTVWRGVSNYNSPVSYLCVSPMLVALHAVAGVDHEELSGVVHACLVSPDLTCLAQHPVLWNKERIDWWWCIGVTMSKRMGSMQYSCQLRIFRRWWCSFHVVLELILLLTFLYFRTYIYIRTIFANRRDFCTHIYIYVHKICIQNRAV